MMPADLARTLEEEDPWFLRPTSRTQVAAVGTRREGSLSTQEAFGDEWTRFPEILDVHERIFSWYFEGPSPFAGKICGC